jgi:hypothetical protein
MIFFQKHNQAIINKKKQYAHYIKNFTSRAFSNVDTVLLSALPAANAPSAIYSFSKIISSMHQVYFRPDDEQLP